MKIVESSAKKTGKPRHVNADMIVSKMPWKTLKNGKSGFSGGVTDE